MSLAEAVVTGVNAILKTLECAICLELLKTPVTAGCGHFFCKFCITKVLKSNYRSPCPLCKKPFTRRSIQEAQQRQFVIQAAKELAEACNGLTSVKLLSKEISDIRKKTSLSSINKQTTVQGSSTSKKRKSHESETSDPNLEDVAHKTKERKSVDNIMEDSNSTSTNDEIIPATNKRHCQSRAGSDEDSNEFPSLEDILKSKAPESLKRKSDETGSSKNISKVSPVVALRRVSDSEISSKRICSKTLEEDVSVIPDTNVSADIAMKNISSRSDMDADVLALNGNKSGKISKSKEKNGHGAKFKSRLSSKNALTNKTNQFKLKKQEDIEKVLEIANKNKETADESESNAGELVKENKEMDVELFMSPAATVGETELSSSPSALRGRKISRKAHSRMSNKNKKSTGQAAKSSAEEESLISKIIEAENISLCILNVTSTTSPSEVHKNSKEKVCFNLVETNLPPVGKETEVASEQQKELVRLEEITDTAVSVQNVESPEAAKIDLVMKSPGWSKVKQVGKDFRVRKFSRLHVEKNTSSSCPSEVLAVELDSLSNEPVTETVNDKKLFRTSDPVAVDYEKQGTVSPEKKEIPDSTSRDKTKLMKSIEHKTCSNGAQIDNVTDMVDDNCCMVDGLNEMTIIINETEKDVVHHEMSCDNQGNKQPSSLQDGKSGVIDKEAHNISIKNVRQSICNSAKQINDVGSKMGSSATLSNCTDVTDLSGFANIDIVSHTNISVIPHVEPDASVEANHVQSQWTGKQTNLVNSGSNFESEFMEVGGIGNAGVNIDDNGSHFQNVCVNQNQKDYLQTNFLDARSFTKQVRASVIDTSKTEQIKEALFKHNYTETNQGKNIFYAEHAQQTSQRLLDFCENNKQTKTLYPPVPLYPAIVEPNAMLKQNDFSVFNPIERFNANVLKPVNTERTKVIKRTCLTLDEIQEAFASSSASGNPENICSLPFSSGDFRLSVCISEETLNISVLKVVNSDSFPGILNKSKTLLLSEKSIQTSNNNTPVPSPTTILPSSNVESEASQPSQPENQQKRVINMKTTNPFPFLSEYFSDSESTEQVAKEAPLNDSEVFPLVEPLSGFSEAHRHSKQDKEMPCETAVEDDNVSPIISVAVYPPEDVLDNLPVTQPYKGDIESDCNCQDEKELFGTDDVGKDNDKIGVNLNMEKSPKFIDVSNTVEKSAKLTKEMNDEPLTMTSRDVITIDNDECTTEKISAKKTVTSCKSLTKGRTSHSPHVLSKNDSKSQRVLNERKFPVSSNNISTSRTPTSKNVSYLHVAHSKSYEQLFDDSEDFSSDPDMAFAMELVAPLKNIAEQMKSTENKEKSKDDLSTMGFSFSLKEKNPMETFEELILSKNKDSFQNSSISQKHSRLSLKSKRSSKKFKRIRTCDSDDDSDASESSKNESMFSTLSKNETGKEKTGSKPENTSKSENLKKSPLQPTNKATSPNDGNLKSNDMHYQSLQDNSTLNSCISEDMTNNSSDIAMEIEDLDQKILSVVEKLKQCGREDLLNQEKLKLLKCADKATTKSRNKDEDCQSSFDSEDSTDIFSQSVPPTPPDATSTNNDSGFKTSMYGHK
ncbi:hypothetical protein JTE90_018299 [Oedothorax gibbosus]|uniref:RING-type domain-containing protein n=1 Tax=Oedothorax gibbosus TaxID=931172 RepID=A0AAV6UFH2_9ARAC|nr:hypothetical protein JTE90_018299 [Oedothorax gibbosus]